MATMALSVGKPAHVIFALNTMYDLLGREGDETAYSDFIKHTGSHDPFGMLFNIPHNRVIKQRS